MSKLEIKSISIQKDWSFTDEDLILSGNSHHNGDTDAIESFMCRVTRKVNDADVYVGNVNGWTVGGQVKVNFQDVALADVTDVSASTNHLITELTSAD